ncbi:MAG: phosphomethylpyrimidine kinase [Candidatus Odinarchaeum yellowstonii]|uniref:Phosphomethylpyrimidine kinase n=1 Tax=Odinarchaeota yellowstonii (strain LCB_4) TaxID=1841599 RepID=A0AAF0IC44_ODILC|nr:MAG: phosphomethylpyrimidine kinase [Candidatus Odinarchaeum yellowstonii]
MDEQAQILGALVKAVQIIEQCREFSLIVPEVRVNIVYALPNAKTTEDIAGIDGRLTVVNGYPRAAGLPRFGASDHMARAILEIRKYRPEIRAGINFKYNDQLRKIIAEYAKLNGLSTGCIERANEPEEEKLSIVKSMPWKIKYLKETYGFIPDIFYETAGWGKEPLFVVIGLEPVKVASISVEVAKEYAKTQSNFIKRKV